MLALLAGTVVKLSYSFPPDVSRTYDVKTVFNGYVPLLGGHEGQVEVDLVVTAKGLAPAGDGSAQVLGTLDDIKVILDGSPLNIITLDSAKAYFPPTTISLTPLGETLKTNAPDLSLPVKLPGLDIKRFPDITYLPLQLPTAGAEVGTAYRFSRAFGDSNIDYTVTPTKVDDSTVEMNVAFSETYSVFETEGKDTTKERKDAAAEVKTDMTGTGTATFDRRLGIFQVAQIGYDARSVVTDLTTKQKTTRDLKNALTIKLRKS